MLVVLDANVFISALLIPGGLARGVVQAAVDGRFDFAVCPRLLAEVDGVARRPKIARAVGPAGEFLADITMAGAMYPDPEVVALTRDSDDDYLVALAIAAGADHLVTGDADLLDLSDPPVAITSLRAFADLLNL